MTERDSPGAEGDSLEALTPRQQAVATALLDLTERERGPDVSTLARLVWEAVEPFEQGVSYRAAASPGQLAYKQHLRTTAEAIHELMRAARRIERARAHSKQYGRDAGETYSGASEFYDVAIGQAFRGSQSINSETARDALDRAIDILLAIGSYVEPKKGGRPKRQDAVRYMVRAVCFYLHSSGMPVSYNWKPVSSKVTGKRGGLVEKLTNEQLGTPTRTSILIVRVADALGYGDVPYNVIRGYLKDYGTFLKRKNRSPDRADFGFAIRD